MVKNSIFILKSFTVPLLNPRVVSYYRPVTEIADIKLSLW